VRRPLKTNPQRQDVLLLAWRDDEGNLHKIPGFSCDLRNGNWEQRSRDFGKFADLISKLVEQYACAIHVTRVQEGVATEVAVLGKGVRRTEQAWAMACRRGYAWDEF
jgi:hypothetical protein